MVTLGIETAAAVGGVALLTAGRPPITRDLGERGRHAEALVPAVAAALDEAGLSHRDLTLIAVDEGPGSFTGIRVGLAFAQGLGAALGCRVAGVGCLDILAGACYDANAPGIGAYIISAADVRRGEWVWAGYRVEAGGPVKTQGEVRVSLADWAPPGAGGEKEMWLAGDAAALPWEGDHLRRWPGSGPQRALAAARLAALRATEGPVLPARPRYARDADARPPRG